MIDFLEEMVCNTNLLPAEHKTAASILRTISKEASEPAKPDLTKLLQPPEVCSLTKLLQPPEVCRLKSHEKVFGFF